MRRTVLSGAALCCCALALGAGCGTTYNRYVYSPRPASVELAAPGEDDGSVVVLGTISDVRHSRQYGSVVEARLRLDNYTDQAVSLPVDELGLFSADLKRFPLVETAPPELRPVPAGENAVLRAVFAFPRDVPTADADLAGLSLRWAVRTGDRLVRRSMTFDRRLRDELLQRDPYYYRRPYTLGLGFGWYDL